MSIEEIREKYGDEVADKVEARIDYANGKDHPFTIYVERENDHAHTIYFANSYMVSIYEVSPKRKRLYTDGEKTIYYNEVKKAHELLTSLQQ